MSADAGEDDGGCNWFVNEVDCAEFKAHFLVGRFGLGGQKNDRDTRS